jgi:predicted nuclease of predicted toxin-antitoxin system
VIIADECLDAGITTIIRNAGYEVLSIQERYSGFADIDILDLVKTYRGTLITEDKDFGELVFAYGYKDVSVIFLRYDKEDFSDIVSKVLYVLKGMKKEPTHKFVTITKHKIRVREI